MKTVYQSASKALLITFFSCGLSLAQEGTTESSSLKLGSLFQDRMVLQRDLPVPIWGEAKEGATVTVEFGGQQKSIQVGADGKWVLKLDPLGSSAESRVMSVSSTCSPEGVSYSDVVVGEVWICSGQSNMAMKAASIKEVKELIPKAKNLRSFQVENTVSFTENSYCNGQWELKGPNSAVAFSFAYFLEEVADVPVGIILTSWGSSSIEGWMPREMTEKLPHFKSIMSEFDANEATHQKIKDVLAKGAEREKLEDVLLRTQPNIIYNAMMRPLVPYACRGLVWYQGEANSKNIDDMLQYRESLPLWIEHYRGLWKRDDLHLLVVMLPGYGKLFRDDIDPEDPSIISWAWMRESQLNIRETPHTGIISTIDLGRMDNAHPKDKLPIGQRLAFLAARDTLLKDVESEGPMMKSATVKGSSLTVEFDNAAGLKTTDGEAPKAFWISDDQAKWVRADAKIEGSTIILNSSEVEKPLYVRYAFSGMPKVNLVNEFNLPAYPFRTDSFQPQ